MKRDDVHHQIQKNGVAKCRALHPICEELLFPIPNGDERPKKWVWSQRKQRGFWICPSGKRIKEEGGLPGAWDLMLPVAIRWKFTYKPEDPEESGKLDNENIIRCPGLIIEIKRPDQRNSKNGGLSEAQVKYGIAMAGQGWDLAIVYTAEELYQAVYGHLREARYAA